MCMIFFRNSHVRARQSLVCHLMQTDYVIIFLLKTQSEQPQHKNLNTDKDNYYYVFVGHVSTTSKTVTCDLIRVMKFSWLTTTASLYR